MRRQGSSDGQSRLPTTSIASKVVEKSKAGVGDLVSAVNPLSTSRNKQALQALAEDVLRSQDVFVKVRSHVGFPANVDALAYDPQSKLLAVSSRGGMTKVIGSDGVESIVLGCDVNPGGCASSKSPFLGLAPSSSLSRRTSLSLSGQSGSLESTLRTAFLGFVKRSILHVSTAGRIRLCRLDSGDLRELSLGGRREVRVRDVTVVASQYLVVGCDVEEPTNENKSIEGCGGCDSDHHIHNCCRVVHVRSGGDGVNSREGADVLEVKPYKIFADQDLEASGRLVCLESTTLSDLERPLILFVYKDSGALVYDVRAEKVLCCAGADECGPSIVASKKRVPTCACWVGDAANCFAIGYEDGSVTVWGISASTIRANPMKGTTSNTREDAVRIMDIDMTEGAQRGAVRSIGYLAGGPGTPHGKECLLVLGGQDAGQPDMLQMVSLEPAGWSREDIVTIPWFGDIISYSLMRDENKVMILTEGGQLVVHDLGTWEPLPVSLKFQELPPLTYGAFLPSVHTSGVHVPSLKNLRFLSWKHVDDCKWPFSGGIPPANYFVTEAEYLHGTTSTVSKKYTTHPSGVLLFGHRDGRVRVWDATSEVPKHMTTVPADLNIIANEGRLMPVTCLDACPLSGLLAVGHEGGTVRVYQFSTTPQSVRKVSLDGGSSMPYDTQIDQNPGWQYILTHALHAGQRITAVCLSSRERAMAVGDDAGHVSIVDLNVPDIKTEYCIDARSTSPSAVIDIRFAALETGECAVFCLCEDGTLEVLKYSADAESRQSSSPSLVPSVLSGPSPSLRPANCRSLLPKPLRPKNESLARHMALLDTDGSVLAALSEAIELSWADNSSTERPRTMGMTKLSNFPQGRTLGESARDFDADAALGDSESEDSEFGDINTNADLWGSLPSPKGGGGAGASELSAGRDDKYPNDSYYANYLKRNVKGVCSYVFVASSDSLRLYSLESVLKGERSPLKKERFVEHEALFCGTFHSVSGSGALVVTRDSVRCYTLPGMEEVGKASVQADGCFVPSGNVGAWAVSLDGHMVLTSSTNELVRYSSLVRAPLPAGPDRLVDPRTYTFSTKTATTVKSSEHNGRSNSSSNKGGRNKSGNAALQSFNSIIGSVKGAATAASGLVAQSMQEIEKFGDEGSKYVQTMLSSTLAPGGPRDLPSLDDVFQKEVRHLDEEITHDDEEDEWDRTAPAVAAGALTPSGSTLGTRTSTATPLSGSAQLRTELLGPRTKSVKKPGRRTVSSVKRQYGVSSRTDDVRSVVEDTRRALAERGEKLSRLEDKAEMLSGEAEDFAALAKELEQAFEKRRWF